MLQERIDQVVKGYELREQIGEGGYGVVYRAYQPLVGRDVAVKIILPQYANHPDFIRRFEWEAQLVARIEHPYIVPLYDYWRDPDGAFLVMRWLRGGNLHDALHNRPLPNEMLGRLIEQIGGALASAHRRGVVHRDLKPANILLDEDGNAYLADFGIAKDMGTRISPYQTDSSTVVGSPAYIAPEQVRAEPITPQTDIYSLGVMLFEILTGQLPFQAPTPIAMMFMHVNEPVPTVRTQRPDLSDAVNAVIQKATAKRPEDRYADVTTLMHDLRRALASGPAVTARLADAPPAPSQPENGGRSTSGSSTRSKYETGILYLPVELAEPVETEVENPYKGLRAFQEADAGDFFGRDMLTQLLLARMQEQSPFGRFLAVVGPSGSGKSSVVRAGVVPAIRRGGLPGSENWFVVEMFPGAHPVEELAQALMRVAVEPPNNLVEPLSLDERGLLRVVDQVVPGADETEVVLVIDQFEEVFTLVEDEAVRAHFLKSLIAAVTDPYTRIRVVVTLRADFYDRPLLYPGFSELMRQRTEVVVPLAPEELKQAIVSPAERNGLRVDPELVEAIVSDVGEQPGALPLLQYALTEVFQRRTGRTLTLTPYNASGGVLGALARRAEEIYVGLNATQQEAARQLFLRLVTLGEGVEDTRRRVRRTELATMTNDQRRRANGSSDGHPSSLAVGASSALDTVIEQYSQYRLLTLDNDPATRVPTVEVAHEALIRTWTRLRQWLDASRDDLRLQRRMTNAAAEWAASGHDRSFLASGARLEQLASWAEETHLALNAEERDYLAASLAERDVQRAQEELRKAHEVSLERRSRIFLRALVGVASLAAVLGIALSIFAFGQRREALSSASTAATARALAEQQKTVAEQQKSLAEQQEALASQRADEARNQALAAAAAAEANAGNIDLALTLALAANEIAPTTLQEEATLAAAAYARGMRDLFTGQEGSLEAVSFSPDDSMFVTASDDPVLVLWDATTKQKIREFSGHEDKVQRVAFSPDGTKLVSASDDKNVILWDVASGAIIHKMIGASGQETSHTDEVKSVAFSPDGKTIISGSRDTSVRLWDVASGQPIGVLQKHTQIVRDVAFSPDGKTALSASSDLDVVWWDIAARAPIKTLQGHTDQVYSVVFSPDGARALTGSTDGTLIYWDLASGQPIYTFRGHTRGVFDVAISRDGRMAASGSQDASIGLWDLTNGQPAGFLKGHKASVDDVTFSSNGLTLLSASSDASVRRWAMLNGAEMRKYTDPTNSAIAQFAISPDGTKALYNSADDTVSMLDLTTGKQLWRKTGHADGITTVAFSPDGKMALSGGGELDTTVILWDAATGAQLGTLAGGHTKELGEVIVTSDGAMAISGGASADGDPNPNQIAVWDLATKQVVRRLAGHASKVEALALSPDGKTLVSGSSDSTLILWDFASGSLLHKLEGHADKIQDVAFSPDGQYVLSAAEDSTLILWDVASGDGVRTFTGHSAAVNAVAFSPDGTRAISGGADALVIVWDVAAGQVLRRFTGHNGTVNDVAYMADGRSALSGGQDEAFIQWRIDTREELIAWTKANRYYPELTCDQQKNFNLELKRC
jgi:WD40 repeat protein/serine/threonine protein kinase